MNPISIRTRARQGLSLWPVFALAAVLLLAVANAAGDLPAKPTRYVSDRAFVLDESQVAALNTKLESFERETSNQIVVAVFANLPNGQEVAQYSTQVFNAWGVGQKDKDNGAVLFIYKNDRKLFIATGRGLEGALPDALCKEIISGEIVPKFRQNDFPGGIEAGVEAMISATKGEYHGSGKTVDDEKGKKESGEGGIFGIFFVIVIIYLLIRGMRGGGGMLLNRGGYNSYGGGWNSGGGFGGGGGGSSGGGGGFSGGGGSSAGGGAGGSW